jgi:hypothetical protein
MTFILIEQYYLEDFHYGRLLTTDISTTTNVPVLYKMCFMFTFNMANDLELQALVSPLIVGKMGLEKK